MYPLMNFFSILLIIWYLYIFTKKDFKEKYILCFVTFCLLGILNLRGYFIFLGSSTEIRYDIFAGCALSLFSIFNYSKIKKYITHRYSLYINAAIVIPIIAITYSILFPYGEPVISNTDDYVKGIYSIRANSVYFGSFILGYMCYLSFIFSCVYIKVLLQIADIEKITKIINKILFFNTIYIAFEFVLKNIVVTSITFDVLAVILGTGKDTNVEFTSRNGLYVLEGLTREPSHVAITLFLTFIFFVIEKQYYRKWKLRTIDFCYCFLILLLLYLSGSFTAVFFMAILIVFIFYFYKKNGFFESNKIIGKIFFCVLLFLVIVTGTTISDNDYVLKRVDGLLTSFDYVNSVFIFGIVNFGEFDVSAFSRMFNIYDSFLHFCNRPILGLTINYIGALGGVVSVLCDLGIIGTFFWMKNIFYGKSYNKFVFLLVVIIPNLLFGYNGLIHYVYIPFLLAAFDIKYMEEKKELK